MERLSVEKSVPLDTNCDVLRDGHVSVAADASVLHPVKEIQDKVRWFFTRYGLLAAVVLVLSCLPCRLPLRLGLMLSLVWGIISGASPLMRCMVCEHRRLFPVVWPTRARTGHDQLIDVSFPWRPYLPFPWHSFLVLRLFFMFGRSVF